MRSACSHHLCPIIGRIWVGVMPNEHSALIGLSKYARCEYKAGAVRLVLDQGKTIAQVARDLNLTATALGDWVAEERAELAQLRKENRHLRMEREILERAAAFFAKENG